MTNTPDWITVGGVVAETVAVGRIKRAAVTTIERLTDTQIVTASGNRYRLRDLRKVGSDRGELRPVTDRSVQDVLARVAYESLANDLYHASRLTPDTLLIATEAVEHAAAVVQAAADRLAAIAAGNVKPGR
jgi:hypothetical protein